MIGCFQSLLSGLLYYNAQQAIVGIRTPFDTISLEPLFKAEPPGMRYFRFEQNKQLPRIRRFEVPPVYSWSGV